MLSQMCLCLSNKPQEKPTWTWRTLLRDKVVPITVPAVNFMIEILKRIILYKIILVLEKYLINAAVASN